MGTSISGAGRTDRHRSDRVQPIDPIIKGGKPNNDLKGSQPFKQANFSSKRNNNESKAKSSLAFNSKDQALNYIRDILSDNSLIITNDNFVENLKTAKEKLHSQLNHNDPYSVANYKSSLRMLTEAFKKMGFGNENRSV
jgi:hypothetical protein